MPKRTKDQRPNRCTRWLRFRIANDAGQFWTGTEWADPAVPYSTPMWKLSVRMSRN